MIYLAVVCVFLILMFGFTLNEIIKERGRAEDKWNEERQILLNRIQDPKYRPPLSPAEKRVDMEKSKELREEFEQFGLVGKIID